MCLMFDPHGCTKYQKKLITKIKHALYLYFSTKNSDCQFSSQTMAQEINKVIKVVMLEIMNKISHFISLLSYRYKIKKCEANNDKIITNHWHTQHIIHIYVTKNYSIVSRHVIAIFLKHSFWENVWENDTIWVSSW